MMRPFVILQLFFMFSWHFLVHTGIQLYSMLGIPRYKMVLGLPWYGYDYPCTSYNAVVSDC